MGQDTRLDEKGGLAQRAITSISWNMVGNVAQIAVGFVRSVLLARLLSVEVFGIYGWAHSVITLSGVFASFGLGNAFLNRVPETANEDQAASVLFTLQLILTFVWALGLFVVALIFTEDVLRRTALMWVTSMAVGTRLTSTPQLILMRRVVHRRLALVQLIDCLLSSVMAICFVWWKATLWALLVTDFVTFLVAFIGFYVWRPVWRPRLVWNPSIVRYFLRYGSRNLFATALLYALDRVDDLWVGTYLDNTAMGLYSRAYTFATYPRKVLTAPISSVIIGIYAELKTDRKRLSQAFYRVNALLVRSGFLLVGTLSLIAPEFIRLLLGAKWLPMLGAFRLMLVYTMFDPLQLTMANVFVVTGRPEQVVQIRSIQLVILIAGLFLLGPVWGIAGVAVAVSVMLVVGIVILAWRVRTCVDFSIAKLFGIPVAGMFVALVSAQLAVKFLNDQCFGWCKAATQVVTFLIVYSGILLSFERRDVVVLVRFLISLYQKHKENKTEDGVIVQT